MRLLCIALLLALPVMARQPKPAPKQPVAATPAPAMAPQRTVEEDNQLKAWITDIMETADKSTARADLAEKHADQAALETKLAIKETGVAEFQLGEANKRLDTVDAEIAKRDQKIAEDAKTIAKFNKVVRYIAAIAATVMALFAFREAKPAGLLSMLSPATMGASIALPVIAWVVTFGLVEAYMHWFFK